MNKLSTERAIDALDTVRAYYASLTAGYPKGKDCKGIGDVTCSEIANSCLMAIKALRQEPCEDVISREKAKQFLYERLDRLNDDELYDIFSRIIDDMYNELPHVTPTHKEWIPVPEGATNKDMFKAVFGYEPATDAVVCNKADWCGDSEPCNYCISNSNNIGREEDWWNAPYKAESEGRRCI